MLASQLMRDQHDLREVFHGFHLHVGVLHIFAVGDDTVVGH